MAANDHIPVDRRDVDVRLLLSMDYNVINFSHSKFVVSFYEPPTSIYRKGVWQVLVTLDETYPLLAPKIQFLNRIFYPNIDFSSGVLSQILINDAWDPERSDLLFLFSQLLVELFCQGPRAVLPYDNEEAGAMYHNNGMQFVRRVEAVCLNQANIPPNLIRNRSRR